MQLPEFAKLFKATVPVLEPIFKVQIGQRAHQRPRQAYRIITSLYLEK